MHQPKIEVDPPVVQLNGFQAFDHFIVGDQPVGPFQHGGIIDHFGLIRIEFQRFFPNLEGILFAAQV